LLVVQKVQWLPGRPAAGRRRDRVGVGDCGGLSRDESARPEGGGKHGEPACTAGERERRRGAGAVDEHAGAGGSGGAADRDRSGEPGERLGQGPFGGGVVDHRVQARLGRGDRSAGEEQHAPERNDAPGRRDLGGGLVTAGVIALVWALTRANDIGWSSAETIITFAGGGVLLRAFLEDRVSEPMVRCGCSRSASSRSATSRPT
jgi:hypothetical protein